MRGERRGGMRSGANTSGIACARIGLSFAYAALVGCVEPRPFEPIDASIDPGPELALAAPVAPAPPVFTPCPRGWEERTIDGITVCEPIAPASCLGGTAPFLGSNACAPVGSTCGTERWPSALPAHDVLYVEATAEGGDGTASAPFSRLSDALAVAAPGATIALAAGHYEGVPIDGDVAIVGVCPERTRIHCAHADPDEPVFLVGGALALRDVAIEGECIGVWAEGEAQVRLDGVLFEDLRTVALGAFAGGVIEGREIAIRRVRPHPWDGVLGEGIVSEYGRLSLERVTVEDTHATGVRASAAGASIQLRDALIRRVSTDAERTVGTGALVDGGAAMTLRRVRIEGTADGGLVAQDTGSRLLATDLVIRDTRGRPDGNFGDGLHIVDGAHGELARVRIERVRTTGISVLDGDAQLVARDVWIRDVGVQRRDRDFGLALAIVHAHATLDRVIARGAGLTALHTNDGSLEAADVRIEHSVSHGIEMVDSEARFARLAVASAHGVGLYIDGSRVAIEDLDVRALRPLPRTDGRSTSGLQISLGSEVSIDRVAIHDLDGVGVSVYGVGARLTMHDARLAHVRPIGGELGIGASALGGGRLALRAFRIEGSALCGLQAALGADTDLRPYVDRGVLDVADGELRGNAFGLCVEGALDLPLAGVRFVDNVENFSEARLSVPIPAEH